MDRQLLRIDLVRHAQDESASAVPAYHPRPDSPLTAYGTEQARATAASFLAQYAGIVCSPILRAVQTAQLFSEVTGVPLITEMSSLSEWRPPSCVYGKAPEEYDDAYREWRYARVREPELAYEDGESLSELHQRALLALHEVAQVAAANGPILVVSHKVMLGVMLARHLDPGAAFQRATDELWAHCGIRALEGGDDG